MRWPRPAGRHPSRACAANRHAWRLTPSANASVKSPAPPLPRSTKSNSNLRPTCSTTSRPGTVAAVLPTASRWPPRPIPTTSPTRQLPPRAPRRSTKAPSCTPTARAPLPNNCCANRSRRWAATNACHGGCCSTCTRPMAAKNCSRASPSITPATSKPHHPPGSHLRLPRSRASRRRGWPPPKPSTRCSMRPSRPACGACSRRRRRTCGSTSARCAASMRTAPTACCPRCKRCARATAAWCWPAPTP